jgi:hypothetical protein
VSDADLLIVGGGTGGCAAALTACSLGLRVVMTCEHGWVGGQLTSQCVPPDENPWIEERGACSLSYAEFRRGVREWYRANGSLTEAALAEAELNPGGGWVSKLCCRPDVAHEVLLGMLRPFVESGRLRIVIGATPRAAVVEGDRVVAVELLDKGLRPFRLSAPFVLDATETGDLLPLCGVEHVVGSEPRSETGEPHATEAAERDNVQGLTWCAVVGYDPDGGHTIEKPAQYDFWRHFHPSGWPCELLSYKMLHVQRGDVIDFPLFGNNGFNLFSYRQVVDGTKHADDREDATVMNWPMNDYYVGSVLDASAKEAAEHYEAARELTLSMLYWLQTEAPRHDEGYGYPELRLRPDLAGTEDGLAQAPYIRESRRIRALRTVVEQDVSASANPGLDRMVEVADSVGIGAYRLDLHPSCNGRGTIDLSSLPFQIPLGCLVPVRVANLLPACKNIGVTHVTNGCYRLHPAEWNVGEAAAALAWLCLREGVEPQRVAVEPSLVMDLQIALAGLGVMVSWGGIATRAL